MQGERGDSSKPHLDPPQVRYCEKCPFFVESKILIINENWLNKNHDFVYEPQSVKTSLNDTLDLQSVKKLSCKFYEVISIIHENMVF